jgi:YesN/AraC family two-component response regulator
MMRNVKSKVLIKYLLSSLAILVVPILIFMVFVNNMFLKLLTDEVQNNNTENLLQVRDTIDAQMMELWKISLNLGNNSQILQFRQKQDPVSGIKLVREISHYYFNSRFAETMYLYYREGKYVYSPSGTCTLDNFGTYILSYSNWSAADMAAELNTLTHSTVKPVDDVSMVYSANRYITYLLPITTNIYNQFATLIFLIKESTFQQILANIVSSSQGNAIIFDKHFTPIVSLENADYLYTEDFANMLVHSSEHNNTTIELDGTQYYFSSIYSSFCQWTYVTIIPVDEVMAKPQAVQRMSLQVLFGLLIIGTLLIYWVVLSNYRPIRKLFVLAEKSTGHELDSRNEIESVQRAIEQISTENDHLSRQMEDSLSAIRDNMLRDLLNGYYRTTEEFNRAGQRLHLTFRLPYFFVSVIEAKKLSDAEKKRAISELEASFSPDYEVFGLVNNTDSIAFIFSSNHAEEKVLYEALGEYHSKMIDQYKSGINIGVGHAYQEIYQIGKSYIEAMAAVDYRLIMGNNRVILFNDILKYEQNTSSNSSEQIEQLEYYLIQGNAEKVSEVLDGIAKFIGNKSVSLFLARSLCYDITSTITKIIRQINTSDLKYLTDTTILTGYDTVAELVATVRVISDGICSHIKNNAINVDAQIERFINYIQHHYAEDDFYIQSMSNHFQISISSLSHFFKDRVGMNISDYVNDLRLKKAKKLLVETDKGLQEIVESIGYINVSSFIRKFKHSVGVTPGDYREINKNSRS